LKTAPHSHRVWIPHYLRIVLHPQPPACVQANSWAASTRRQVRLNKYADREVLFCSQVRSHPILVLPSMGGRCSLGFLYVQSGVNDCGAAIQQITQISTDYNPASRGTHCTELCWQVSKALFLVRKIVLFDVAEPPASRRNIDNPKRGKSISNP
jgi:hypothetical protein